MYIGIHKPLVKNTKWNYNLKERESMKSTSECLSLSVTPMHFDSQTEISQTKSSTQ
jgi:hypothetical protein